MSGKEKFLLGGVGALIPIVLTIAVADGTKISEYLNGETYSLVGYVIRAAALFLLGAVYAYVDGTISSRRKAIEVGLAAPALLSAWLSAANVVDARRGEPEQAVWFGAVSSAYAQDNSGDEERERPSPFEQFIKGILGR